MINDYETIERERKREELWRIAEAEERREKQHEKEKIAIRKQEKADRIKAIAYREMEKSRDLASTVRRNLEITKSCPYCDCYLKVDEIHADHIHPVSKGGLSIETNMIMVCSACNSKKSDLTLNQFIAKFGLNRKVIEYNLSRLNKDF
jgi:5-methylcytosine-specific restriction endonuclease McrA